MRSYEDYLKKKFDLSAFGIFRGEDRSDYFCTPKGAKIIGWTGVDGIHYCLVKVLGETVFAVEPMGDAWRHVFPVAKNFEDFLRLLMSCGHEAYTEQAHAWSREKYDVFAENNPVSDEAKALIEQLKEQYALAPMDDPFKYLKEIYESFDFSSVPYKKDYYEFVPKEELPQPKEWKVYFSLHERKVGERAGKELPLNVAFSWAGYEWSVPCAYVCAKGLVLDLFAETDAKKAQEYLFRQMFSEDGEEVSEGSENPFAFDFRACITLNGNVMKENSASGNCWAQGFDFYESGEMRSIIEHYGLSLEKCYIWRRISFPFVTKTKPIIKTLKISLEQRPLNLQGPRFFVSGSGDQIKFTHPVTNIEHTLNVKEYGQDKLNFHSRISDGYEHPAYCTKMVYTLSPGLTNMQFSVSDIRHSDAPKKASVPAKEYDFVSTITKPSPESIIGGADGPTAVIFGVPKNEYDLHAACSALTFEPQSRVEWKMVFREKTVCDTEIDLLQT